MIATVDEAFAFASKLRSPFTVERRVGLGIFGGDPGTLGFKVAKRERLLRFCPCPQRSVHVPGAAVGDSPSAPANGER